MVVVSRSAGVIEPMVVVIGNYSIGVNGVRRGMCMYKEVEERREHKRKGKMSQLRIL